MKPEQLSTLGRMVGSWKGEHVIFESGGRRSEIDVDLEVRGIVEGWGLEGNMIAEIPGVGRYVRKEMWGYDTDSDTIRMFSVTNDGKTHHRRGVWVDDNTLRLKYSTVTNGKDHVVEEMTVVLYNHKMSLRNTTRVNGEVELLLEGTLSKS
jgi:hypothetical protein